MTVSDNMYRKLVSIPKGDLPKIVAAAKTENRSVSNYLLTLALKDIEEKESRGVILNLEDEEK